MNGSNEKMTRHPSASNSFLTGYFADDVVFSFCTVLVNLVYYIGMFSFAIFLGEIRLTICRLSAHDVPTSFFASQSLSTYITMRLIWDANIY